MNCQLGHVETNSVTHLVLALPLWQTELVQTINLAHIPRITVLRYQYSSHSMKHQPTAIARTSVSLNPASSVP